MDSYENKAMGHMPKLEFLKTDACKDHYFKNGTLNNSCLSLSSDLMGATLVLMTAELGDKTFLLITLFTMAWSTWHLKENAEDEVKHEKDDKDTPSVP